jgi:hypothetical protein
VADPVVRLQCPECARDTLECQVSGRGRDLTVTLLAQSCVCDPFHDWEEVWEQARERVYEEQSYD